MSATDHSSPPVPLTAFERKFKHPQGLAILFFTEMWERFSYYGMRGLLKLYMVNYLFVTLREEQQGCRNQTPPCELVAGDPNEVLFWGPLQQLLPSNPQEVASLLYGTYTALVYATPFFGGMIADRWLGQRKTVVVGATLMALGHFVMAFESYFFVALGLLILGNGAFKPNVSTQVGGLYGPSDSRRDGAYTIFYMGINLGAFLSNLVCGTLAAVFGWHYGFGAAGVGMLLGLTVYLLGQRHLAPDLRSQKNITVATNAPLDAKERRRVGALVLLCLLNVVFWAVYEQQGNTMQSWADERTDWPSVFGFQIPSTWFQSFNPLAIVLLAPLLDTWWRWQAAKGSEPSTVSKMAIGCVLLGSSFIIMIVGARVVGTGVGSPLWPLACTLLLTLGELYLSPTGLSLVSKVSPARVVSMVMGVWLASSFLGNFLSGLIGVLYTRWSAEAFFALLTALGLAAGLAIQALNRPLQRAMATSDAAPSPRPTQSG
jgi:proton-dependent oligopeptide transporter, POT family